MLNIACLFLNLDLWYRYFDRMFGSLAILVGVICIQVIFFPLLIQDKVMRVKVVEVRAIFFLIRAVVIQHNVNRTCSTSILVGKNANFIIKVPSCADIGIIISVSCFSVNNIADYIQFLSLISGLFFIPDQCLLCASRNGEDRRKIK